MEGNDEPDQPISVGRQEIRKRRRPSQPMVDKSQQTEVAEIKKYKTTQLAAVPKSTFSIDSIPGNKGGYSAKEYETCSVSSQLQQTWTKRKHGQGMTDKSFQTDASKEEKKEVKSFDEAVGSEEMLASVGEASPELPENIQGVEITPSVHPIQLKVDRSQQTSCTGDWTMMYIPQVEKVDKGLQTHFSDPEAAVISRPFSSFTKSEEGVQKGKSSGKIVSDHSEFQPATSSNEEIRQKSSSRDSIIQETKKDTPLPLEDGSRQEVSFVKESASLEMEPLPTEKETTEGQSLPAEEATAKVESRLAEETPTMEEAAPTTTEAVPPPPVEEAPFLEPQGEIQPPLVEETLSEGPFSQIESSPAEVAPEEFPAEIPLPQAEETPVRVQPTVPEDELDEAPVKAVPAEEAPAEVQAPLAEEAPIEENLEPGLLKTTQAPEEEAPAEVHAPSAEEAPIEENLEPGLLKTTQAPEEEAPAEVQAASAEEAPIEENLEPGLLKTTQAPEEEAPAEVQSLIANEPPKEKTSPEVQLLTAEEASVGNVPQAAQPPQAKDVTDEVQSPSHEQSSIQKVPAEAQPEQAEEVSAEEAPFEAWSSTFDTSPIEKFSAEVQPPLTEETSAEVPAKGQSPSLQTLVDGLAKVKFPVSEEVSTEDEPPEVQLPSFQENLPEETLDNSLFLQTQEITREENLNEFLSLPYDELSKEEDLNEVQSISAGGVLAEDAPIDKHLSPSNVVPMEEFPVQERPAEVPPPPSEQTPAHQAVLDNVSPELQSPQVAGVSEKNVESVVLEDDKKFEEVASVPEGLSNAKEEHDHTIEIEGVIKIKLNDNSS